MDCVFCKIIAKDIPAQIVYENDSLIVIRDINPQAPVHDLIIPKKHTESLNDMNDPVIAAELILATKEVARIEGVDKNGYRLIANTGKDGGQLVPHLHFHLLGGKNLGPKIVS